MNPDELKLQNAGGIRSLDGIPFDDYWAELKYDGMRGKIFRRNDGSIDLHSRTGKSQLGKCKHIEDQLMQMPPGTILDGEFVLIPDDADTFAYRNLDGSAGYSPIPDFNRTMRIMGSNPDEAIRKQDELGKITFVAFDILMMDSKDLTDLPLYERREHLEQFLFWYSSPYIHLAEIMIPDEKLLADLMSIGAEGIMVKDRDGAYECGKRSKYWRKLKFVHTTDVVIMGATPGNGKYQDTIGAIQFGQYRDGVLIPRGQTSGMTDEIRREVGSNLDAYIGRVMEIKHMGTYPNSDGVRHPQFYRMREEFDKAAEDCTWSN